MYSVNGRFWLGVFIPVLLKGPKIVQMNGVIENRIISVDSSDVTAVEVQPNKRRRKKSIVWEYFTVEPISPDCSRACCKQCKKSFAYMKGSKQAGTSHLKRHIDLGICPVNRLSQEKIQHTAYTPGTQNGAIMAPPRKRCRASPGSVTIALDREHYIDQIARMVILHDYPTHMVEQSGFVNFIQCLQPHISMTSFDSVQREIVSIYLREKQVLSELIAGIPGRVSLTLDLWTSDESLGYAILTGHFIDADWRLQRRVLNFVEVPFPNSEVAFNHAIVSCLSVWNLENKLFALTLDRSFASEAIIGNIRELLSMKNPHMLNSQFFIVDCYARIMSCLAQEALAATCEVVGKVRDFVKYLKLSESCQGKLNELRRQLFTKSLVIDNHGKWDTTYRMLSKACELKEGFSCVDTSDPDYRRVPSLDDWKHIEVLCVYLKLFLDAADILTSETYPTTNEFYHEACKIQMELAHGALSEDPFISNFVQPLYEKFDKYWRNCCVVLAMAVAMDPRFKLKLVEFSFNKIYGEEAGLWTRTVDDALHELFLEYIAQTLPLPSFNVDEEYDGFVKTEFNHDEEDLHPTDGFSDFDVYISEISSNHQTKSELDQYLEELLLSRELEEFDVIEWWKYNRIKYPTLSKMAADILSVPMATISQDSVFNTTRKKLDSHRCSMKPVTLEALVCANNWLQCGAHSKSSMLDDISTVIVEKKVL